MKAYYAHDLCNILHAIDSALNSMPSGLPYVSQILVDTMKIHASFMYAIMNNLLDVLKIEEGKTTLNLEPTSIKACMLNVEYGGYAI